MEAHAEGLEGRPQRAEVLTFAKSFLVFHRTGRITQRFSSGAMKESRLHPHLEAAFSFSDSGFTLTPVGMIRAPPSLHPKNLDRMYAPR
jgi:hypothetical protein